MKVAYYGTYKGVAEFNNDILAVGKRCYLVGHGATPLHNDRVFSDTSDVNNYMRTLESLLRYELGNDKQQSIISYLEGCIRNANYNYKVPVNVIPEQQLPTFTVGCVTETEDNLEVYVIGDITVTVTYKDGSVDIITDERIIPFKEYNKIKIENLKLDGNATPKAIKEVYADTRMRANTEAGYPICSTKAESARNGIISIIDKSLIKGIVLSTKGLNPADLEHFIFGMDIAERMGEIAERKDVGNTTYLALEV